MFIFHRFCARHDITIPWLIDDHLRVHARPSQVFISHCKVIFYICGFYGQLLRLLFGGSWQSIFFDEGNALVHLVVDHIRNQVEEGIIIAFYPIVFGNLLGPHWREERSWVLGWDKQRLDCLVKVQLFYFYVCWTLWIGVRVVHPPILIFINEIQASC